MVGVILRSVYKWICNQYWVTNLFMDAVYGLKDSLSIHSAILLFLPRRTQGCDDTRKKNLNEARLVVARRFLQCFLLNIVLFAGSIAVLDYILTPLLNLFLFERRRITFVEIIPTSAEINTTLVNTSIAAAAAAAGSEETVETIGIYIGNTLLFVYRLLLVYPIYGLSALLSRIWYQDISDHTFMIIVGSSSSSAAAAANNNDKKINKKTTFPGLVKMVAEEIYRHILTGAFLIQSSLVAFIPVIGPTLAVLHLSWFYAQYSFEYKWSQEKKTLDERLFYLETRWAYFAGFGLPAAIFTICFIQFIAYGVFACIFPVFMVLAIIAPGPPPLASLFRPSPPPPEEEEEEHENEEEENNWEPPPLPIFYYSKRLNGLVLRCVKCCFC